MTNETQMKDRPLCTFSGFDSTPPNLSHDTADVDLSTITVIFFSIFKNFYKANAWKLAVLLCRKLAIG